MKARESPANKWAKDKVLNRILSPVTKRAGLRVSSTNKCRHSSRGGPSIEQKLNVNNKGSRLNLFVSKHNTVGNTDNDMTNRDFKLKERRLPGREAIANGL